MSRMKSLVHMLKGIHHAFHEIVIKKLPDRLFARKIVAWQLVSLLKCRCLHFYEILLIPVENGNLDVRMGNRKCCSQVAKFFAKIYA
jgi:hypothetical protein